MKNKNKDKHLKISDVDKLKVGDVLDVFVYDRNFYDGLDDFEENKPYKATDILKHSHMKLHYKGGHVWDIEMSWGTYEHPIELSLEKLDTNWKWSPLQNDMIHITNNITRSNQKVQKGWKPIHMHYDEFPKDTRVGWRGPMIPWKYVKFSLQWHFNRSYRHR